MPLDTAGQRPLNNNNGDEAGADREGPCRLDDSDSKSNSNSSPPSPSAQQQQQAQLAALLRFRPSSRDVISGIAPHVFDDHSQRSSSPHLRNSRNSRRRRNRTSSSPERRRRSVSPAQHRSPLRLSAVISVDEHGPIIQPTGEETVVLEVYTAPYSPSPPPSRPIVKTIVTPISSPSPNQNNKPKRQGFRIDRVLKTLLVFRKDDRRK